LHTIFHLKKLLQIGKTTYKNRFFEVAKNLKKPLFTFLRIKNRAKKLSQKKEPLPSSPKSRKKTAA